MGVTISVGLDLAHAPVPARRYAAELCQVTLFDNELRLTFAQRTPSGKDLDSVLVLRLNPKAALGFVDSVEQMNNPGIAAIAKSTGVEAEKLHVIDSNPVHPGNFANMIANFVAVGVSEYEACMDFYHASAFSMGSMKTGGTLDMEPKVRVDIRTSLLVSLMSEASDLVQKFR
jgi:hypothetical protein